MKTSNEFPWIGDHKSLSECYTNIQACNKYDPQEDNNTDLGSITDAKYIEEKDSEVFKKDDNGPVSVFDVAAYILKAIHSCTTMKLHKLLYYCQAWNLVWEDAPLFSQPIEAWANGPVIRVLYNFHKGKYTISYMDMSIGNENSLSVEQKRNVDEVLDYYGKMTAQNLIDLTHLESPWIKARAGAAPTERSTNEITLESMSEYYSSL
jgi:uncharacterized phage-associated protein